MPISGYLLELKERNKIMKTKVVALTLGICGSICIFILTWWLIIIGNADGPPLLIERVWIIGYSVTPLGSVVGAIYGFIDFAIMGLIFSWIYNSLEKKI